MKTSTPDARAAEARRLAMQKTSTVTPVRQPQNAQEVTLDRRAKRNVENLGGGSNFSSSNLKPVGAKQSVHGKGVDEQRGFDALATVHEIHDGVVDRTDALEDANKAVANAEEKLAEHLLHLDGALSDEQLKAYADEYRSDTPAYATAEAAAAELAGYVAQNAERLAQAHTDVETNHPLPHLNPTGHTAVAMEEATAALEAHVAQTPSGSAALQATLGTMSTAMGVAEGAAEGLAALGELAPRLSSLAAKASAPFGILGGAADFVAYADRLADGGRVEHVAGLAASAVLVGQGVLTIAGVTVSAPVSVVAGAVSLAAGGVSAYRDHAERVADMSARLTEMGLDPAQAEALARSNPASLDVLKAAGYSSEQVQRLAALGETWLLNTHESEADYFARASTALGLSPEASVVALESIDPGLVSSAAHALGGLLAGGATTREEILKGLNAPIWGVPEEVRSALLTAFR